jgi:hypothetical protein
MNTRRSPLYLAHSYLPLENESEPGACSAGLPPEEAAQYIGALLSSLRAMAIGAELSLLADLLSVAEEEAKLHCRI